MEAKGKRADRVGERLKVELMELIVRGGLRNPVLADCYVTAVRLTDDLRHARVYVRTARLSEDEATRQKVVRALAGAAGFLRRELAPKLSLKHQPDFTFFWDDSVDHATRIEEVLAEIKREGEGAI
jgi:ribosome-binding factor A